MSGLGHVLNLTRFWDDFHDDVCLRSLQRQGTRGAAQGTRAKWKEIQMSSKRVPARVRVVAAALAVVALLGGVAATETAASAGRGLNIHAGRGL
jgi:hypothetical protein